MSRDILVLVEWHDAVGGVKQGWRDIDKMETEPQMATSVGFLIRKKGYVLIVPHRSKDNDGDGEIAIQNSWISNIYSLKRGRRIKL